MLFMTPVDSLTHPLKRSVFLSCERSFVTVCMAGMVECTPTPI